VVLAPGGGGGGGGYWDGTISVVPGNLEASAPGFSGAGDEVGLAMASTIGWGDPAGVGITDGQAGSAWGQLATVWGHDLGQLQETFYSVGEALIGAAVDYHATDTAVMNACPAPP